MGLLIQKNQCSNIFIQIVKLRLCLGFFLKEKKKRDKRLVEVNSLSYLPAGRQEVAGSRGYSLVSPRRVKGTAACCSWQRGTGVWSEGRILVPGGLQSPPAPTGSPPGAQRPDRCPTAPGRFGHLREK